MTFITRFANFIDVERCIHSLKTALACLIGFVLIRIAYVPVDQWLIITIIVVMTAQINVGSMLEKSYLRFFGTVAGCIIAVVTIKTVGIEFFPNAMVIVTSIAFFSYIATGSSNIREAGTLGAATVVIILVGQNPTVLTAIERCLEITAGILIAAFVSQFILPIHARSHLRRTQIETLDKLREYYQTALLSEESRSHEIVYHKLEQPIMQLLAQQRALAQAAKREPLGEKFNPEHFTQFLQCEIEILRSIDFMHYAYERYNTTRTILLNLPLLKDFHEKIILAMEKIESIIEYPDKKNQGIFIPSLESLKTEIKKLGLQLASEEETTIDAFLFCSEILVEQLKKLMVLYQIENL
jgi:uncharacterized membrane protein YccC